MKIFKRKSQKAQVFAFVLLAFLCFAGKTFAQTDLENLAQLVTRGNSEQKRNALFEIRNLKTAEASRLALPALQDSEEIVRASAVSSVIFLPSDEAVRVLVPLLRDKKPFVRKEAAYALGKTQNSAAVQPLVETIQKDKIQEVKDAATVALGENGRISAINALVQVLQRQPKDKEEFIRRAAAHSLGKIALGRRILQQRYQQWLDSDNSTSDFANEARTNLSREIPAFQNALRLLIQILQTQNETDDVKREAAYALGEIGDVSAIPVLQANLNSEDYYLAENCKLAIKKINDSRN